MEPHTKACAVTGQALPACYALVMKPDSRQPNVPCTSLSQHESVADLAGVAGVVALAALAAHAAAGVVVLAAALLIPLALAHALAAHALLAGGVVALAALLTVALLLLLLLHTSDNG